MRKIKKWIKEHRKYSLTLIVIVVLFSASVFFDNLLSAKFEAIFSLENVSVAVFSAVATISAIWTTYYLLLFQLYKDKYPLHLVQSSNQPRMNLVFLYVMCALIMGIVVLLLKDKFLPSVCYLSFSVYTIIRIFNEVYHVNKSLMVNTYIDDYCSTIKRIIEAGKEIPDKTTWNEVAYILDESITREEYLVAQNITDNLGSIFREFMEESISIVGDGKNKSRADELFSQIVSFNMTQLSNCKNVKSEMLIRHVVAQNYKNIEFCINANQYEWFKQYVNKENQLIFILLGENQEELCDAIIPSYNKTLNLLIKQEKDEWWKYLTDKFFSMIEELNFISGNYNLKYFIRLLTTGFICAIDIDREDAFSFLLDTLNEFTQSISRIPKAFTDIKAYYAMIFNKVKKDSLPRVEALSDLIFSKEVSMPDDEYWLEFKFYCIKELKEVKSNPDLTKKIEDYHIQAIIDAVDFRDKYQGILFIPNFGERIKDNINSAEKIDEVIVGLKKTINRCIIKDNIPAFNTFLGVIDNCFDKTSQSNKLCQEKLFDLYLWLIRRTSALINQQFLELTFDQIRETIESLDKRRAVSASFTITIIQGLAGATQSAEKQNRSVVNEIIDLLFCFLNEETALNFVLTSASAKKQLCRSLFNIGTYCVEENYEEGLRRVSNSLGWLAIYSIRQGTSDLTTYILGRAEELYKISAEMDVSPKTMTFLLTLFTTIGTYCCKDKALKKYLDQIINSLDGANIQSIKTAIRLRTSENDVWNDLYENRTKELTTKFMKAFSQQANNNK